MKLIARIVITVFLLMLMAAMFGCGTRKSNKNKNSSSSSQKEKQKESLNTEVSNEVKNSLQFIELKDAQEENVTTVVEEVFDNPLPGQPNKKTTTTTKGNKTDKGKITSSNQSEVKNNTNTQQDIERVKEANENAKELEKSTKADKTVSNNVGGSWVFILIVLIVVGAIFFYFYLKRKK